MTTLSFLALLLAALVAFLFWCAATAWRRVFVAGAAEPPALLRAMERVGATPADMQTVADVEQAAIAMRRCTFCVSGAACRASMAGNPGMAFLEHCPNAGFLSRVARG